VLPVSANRKQPGITRTASRRRLAAQPIACLRALPPVIQSSDAA
jgi:hypothetical protein